MAQARASWFLRPRVVIISVGAMALIAGGLALASAVRHVRSITSRMKDA